MDVAVIGTGAIGGYYGGRLAKAGHAVHFLARSTSRSLRDEGLSVHSIDGDFRIADPLVYDQVAAMPPCDLVLVTVKATANRSVLPSLGPVAKAGGGIVLMQNGFGVEDQLAALYPESRVYAGLCFICSFREGPATVRHTAYGRISLAAHDDGAAGLDDLAGVFAGAGLEVEALGGVLAARLRKLVWNIPYNGLSVVLDATTRELSESPAMRAAVRALMDEVVGAAAACGVVIEPEFVEAMMGTTAAMGAYEPSMRLDRLAGRPLEIDAIYSNVIAFAAERGFAMARAAQLRDELAFLEERRRAG
jgi:2-dehydropantoate 2-reductase